jgi:hypothetical protein
MDYLTMWPEAYAIPNQEASTVAGALVTIFFCRFGVLWELHSDQGRNFESRLLQEVSSCLGVSETHHAPAPAVGQYDGALHQNGRGSPMKGGRIAPERLGRKIAHHPPSLQVIHSRHYRLAPASLIFVRDLGLPCDLLFGAPPDNERPTIDHAAYLVDHLHDIHNYALKHLKLPSDQMKTHYDKLANFAGYHVGERVWLCRPTRNKVKSPNLQSSWECPHKIFTRIFDVVHRIQKKPRSRMMVLPLDRLAPYQGAARDEQL